MILTLSKYFRVIAPDIVGFGYSDKPTVEYTMDFFLDFFNGFLDSLDLSKISVIGSSFGGHLATEFAIRFNRKIDRLVLASPAGIMRTSTPTLDGYIMAALYPTYKTRLRPSRRWRTTRRGKRRDCDGLCEQDEAAQCKVRFMSTLLGMRYAPKLQGRLSKIISPTLLVWGDSDKMIPVQYSKDYSEIPDSELVVIKNCGHTPFVEKPMTFNKLVLKFLVASDQ